MRKLAFMPAAAVLFSLSFGPTAGAVDLGLEPLYTKAPNAPTWSWTGFYLGGHVGGGWANTTWLEDITKSGSGGVGPIGLQDASHTASGLLGGGQVGINYQTGRWVFGIEGDVSGANLTGSSSSCFPEVAGTTQTCSSKVDALGTVTGRVGATFDRSLAYVKGGFGWVNESYLTAGAPSAGSAAETRGGWTLGAGLEYSFKGPWSGKVEYDYLGLGTRNVKFTNAPGFFTEDVRDNAQVVKLGINYRFGWGAPAAPNH
ncbi:MAG: outer membrane protein [Xanthobacteraceae bacterium]